MSPSSVLALFYLYLCVYLLVFLEKSNFIKEGRRNKVLAPINFPRVITPQSLVILCGAGLRTLEYYIQTQPGSWPLLCTLQCYISNPN